MARRGFVFCAECGSPELEFEVYAGFNSGLGVSEAGSDVFCPECHERGEDCDAGHDAGIVERAPKGAREWATVRASVLADFARELPHMVDTIKRLNLPADQARFFLRELAGAATQAAILSRLWAARAARLAELDAGKGVRHE